MYNFSVEVVKDLEFPQLKDAVYVDHAGSTLFSKSQMDAIHKDLTSNLYGNPHSHNYSSKISTDSVDQVRYRLLRFFGASPDEYSLVFTSNCTTALKLVADNFNFGCGKDTATDHNNGVFCFLQDNHTSVQGIRGEVARRNVSVVCVDGSEVEEALAKGGKSPCQDTVVSEQTTPTPPSSSSLATASLFAFPAQSNFSGKKYPSSWIKKVQDCGLHLSGVSENVSASTKWYVLLDAASYVSTSPLHLGRDDFKPDFVTLSFYKIFGYPTGVGALLVHRRAESLLVKSYFGGGTVEASAAKVPFQMFRKSLHDRFEDGTLPFLSIIGLRHGLDAVQTLAGGMAAVSQHVFCVARYFYDHLTRLRHSNGRPMAAVYGGATFSDPEGQGGIVTFNLKRADGKFIGYAEVDKFAHLHDVHLRTGCFCNIGACQEHLCISSQTIKDNFSAGHVCGDNMDLIDGSPTGAVRVSFGYMSTLDDALACLSFISHTFLETVGPMPSFPYPEWYTKEKLAGGDVGKMKMEGKVIDAVGSESTDGAGGRSRGRTVGKDGGNEDAVAADKVVKVDERKTEERDERKEDSISSLPPENVRPFQSSTNIGQFVSDGNGNPPRLTRRVTDIFLYPIKSCGAFRVSEWEMGSKGFLYDREWVLASDSGLTIGQKREPKICLLSPTIDLASRTLTLSFPGETTFELPLDQEDEAAAMANLCNNKVCGDRVTTFDCGDAVADWLSNALLRPGIRLLRQQSQDTRTSKQRDRVSGNASTPDQRLSLANESQMLLLNRASVRALQDKMAAMGHVDESDDTKLPTNPQDISEDNMVLRFRGNLVVDSGQAFEEESWTSIRVGDNTVMCQNVCTRCSMICMDQTTACRSREPLRTLAVWRGKKVPFGVHSRMLPPQDGKRQFIQVGDPITLV